VPNVTAPAPLATDADEAEDAALLPPLAVPIPIEDPSGHALTAFHAGLARAEAGAGQARIVFYGASHVASDVYTGLLRERLQQRFGNAGIGFVMPAKPWRWHRLARVEYDDNRGFTAVRIRAPRPIDGIYGLAGVAFDAPAGRHARTGFRVAMTSEPTGAPSRIEVSYLEQPRGGSFGVFVDGERVRTIATNAPAPRTAFASFETTDAEHHVELRTHADGSVRVFGVAVERSVPGVVLDTLGIPGSRARFHLHWDEATQSEQLARRAPDLVVLAYGTNESGDDDVPMAEEEARIDAVVRRVRTAVPAASCILIGPSDRPREVEEGIYEPRARTELLTDAQRRVAFAHGCGFFDLVEFMGGPLSMLRWAAGVDPLGNADLVHFTHRGYERLGEVLHDALLTGYVPDAAQTPAGAP
jgi:lysophospholipase L1-like esterase